MIDETLFDYLYIAEWDDSVHCPPFTVMHKITLRPGVTHEEFEKFVSDNGFSQAGGISTRVGQIAAQYLLKPASGVPSRVEDLDVDLSPLATCSSATTLQLVHGWRRESH